MDHTQQQAASQVLTDLANDGGGTYQVGTLLPFRPSNGFAVGVGGLHLPATQVNAEAVAWAMKAVCTEYETSYGGTWLSDGIVYFDAVQYFGSWRREDAIQAGRDAGQKAIYDFGSGKDIVL